jgi:hypothetical protein
MLRTDRVLRSATDTQIVPAGIGDPTTDESAAVVNNRTTEDPTANDAVFHVDHVDIELRADRVLRAAAAAEPASVCDPAVGESAVGVGDLTTGEQVTVGDRDVAGHPAVQAVYDEAVHWRKSFMQIPRGSSGKALAAELATQLRQFVESEGRSPDHLLAFFTLPALTLQRVPNVSNKDTQHLRRRLDFWESGDIASLLDEGRSLQHRHPTHPSTNRSNTTDEARAFKIGRAHV